MAETVTAGAIVGVVLVGFLGGPGWFLLLGLVVGWTWLLLQWMDRRHAGR